MNESGRESQQVHGPNGHDHETTADSLVQAMTAIERLGGRLSTGATGLGESAIASIGALVRRLISQLGETARAGLDQAAETTQQIVHVSQDTLERGLEAAGSVAEEGVRVVERISIRVIDAASEIGGALLGRLPEPTGVARASRSRGEPATSIVQAAS